ncbi:hypothetical protein BDQ17DRAFT_1413213 [Cyathus striatus]|nr:hypothetical protein BDQ17DRAFT_1413213 [Cyathus striatus]
MQIEPEDEYIMFAKTVETELQGVQRDIESIIKFQDERRKALLNQKNEIETLLGISVNNLGDISQFWNIFEKDDLSPITKSSPRGKATSKGQVHTDVDKKIQKWKDYITSLRSAVSTISEASDAGLVEPHVVLGSQPTAGEEQGIPAGGNGCSEAKQEETSGLPGSGPHTGSTGAKKSWARFFNFSFISSKFKKQSR